MKHAAVLLAAGRGSRLSEHTEHLPKAILPIGPRSASDKTETCFLRRQVELLEHFKVDPIVVVIGYMHELMRAELAAWAPRVRITINPTPEIETSGSLHSLQYALREHRDLLDGSRQTLYMDADIVYHRDVLRRLIEAPTGSVALVCDRHRSSDEEVLIYGTADAPRYIGKGLSEELVQGERCLGEAVGIVRLAPADQPIALKIVDWMIGSPDAPITSLQRRGFGPARKATEHEELTQRLMHYGRMGAVVFSGEELPFMEVDTPDEYRFARSELMPKLVAMEQ